MPNSFSKMSLQARINWSNTIKGGNGGGKRIERQKRGIVGEPSIRTLQVGVIYQDNEEGRRKKAVFEVSKLLHQDDIRINLTHV